MSGRVGLAWAGALAGVTVLWAASVPWPVRGRLDATTPLTQLTALRPLLAALTAAVGLVALAVLVRRGPAGLRGPVALLLAGALAACAQIAPRALADARPAPAGAPHLTVLAANTLASGVPATVVGELVARTGADVVALPETNLATARRYAAVLRRASGEGWLALADGAFAADEPGPRPTALLARTALAPRPLPGKDPARGGHGEVRVALTAPGGVRARVAAVHPVPPPPASTSVDAWRDDLLALRAPCRKGWILAGDLNATVDHSPVRALLDAGCTDAAAATGSGLRATWHGGPLAMVRPAIDHVLAAGAWRPVDAGVLQLDGSDHEAVWATLTTG